MDGYLEVRGRVLYASQEAWVFSGTLRENILFGQPYQSDRYNAVVEACALDKVGSVCLSSSSWNGVECEHRLNSWCILLFFLLPFHPPLLSSGHSYACGW